ncbi:MAG: hypothetical protein ACHQ4G_03720 [Opitutales bacterium]
MSSPGYTLNPKALERGRDGRLTLTPATDGGWEVAFRFEGSTCSNVPLTMIYRVTLGPAAEGYPIRAMGCRPAEGADGHERMCSFLNTEGRILEIVDSEQPLLGQPLDAVLTWRPITLSAGCLCAPPSRNHKWSTVLQTLHFALHAQPGL